MDGFWHGQRRTTEIVMLLMAFMITCRSASGQTEETDAKPKDTKSPQASASDSLKQLQGKWKSVKSTYKEANYFEGWAIRFRDHKVTEIMPAKDKEEEGDTFDFTLDESKSPKWIDVGERKGIFQLKGDMLIICFGDKKHRPTEFKLAPAPAEAPVVPPGAYPILPARAPGVGYWVPYDLTWEESRSELWVFKKVP
jgi:uncharacterized protein (TIGR03067 family)